MDVTVDGNDLLALLTGAADKTIVDRSIIDRLARQYNLAGREPQRSEPTSGQMARLLEFFVTNEHIKPVITVDPRVVINDRDLLSDGWIEFGVRRGEDFWTATQEKTFWTDPAQLCRLTKRGDYFVREHMNVLRVDNKRTGFEKTGIARVEHIKITGGS